MSDGPDTGWQALRATVPLHEQHVWTREELMAVLGLGEDKLRELLAMPGFPVVDLGGRSERYPRRAVLDWLDEAALLRPGSVTPLRVAQRRRA